MIGNILASAIRGTLCCAAGAAFLESQPLATTRLGLMAKGGFDPRPQSFF